MVTPMGDSTNDDSIPALEGDAAVAVEHEGTHIQIIAAAGSGKTEVVSQRVAALIAKGFSEKGVRRHLDLRNAMVFWGEGPRFRSGSPRLFV